MRLKSKYKAFRDGGAVTHSAPTDPDEAVSADVPPQSQADTTASALMAQVEALRAPPPEPQDGLDTIELPPLAKDWLRANPEYLHDEAKNARLQKLHYELVDEGYEGYSQNYFDEASRRLAAPPPRLEPAPRGSGPRRIASAPPSRHVPSSDPLRADGRLVELTPSQREAARISCLSDEEYKEQLVKLYEAKQRGEYLGQP